MKVTTNEIVIRYQTLGIWIYQIFFYLFIIFLKIGNHIRPDSDKKNVTE